MVQIDKNADIGGLRPSEYINKSASFIIGDNGDGDALDVEEREPKNGDGKFKQYTLHLKDGDEPQRIRFLFERDVAKLAQAYGEDSTGWLEKPVTVTAVPDGQYARFVLQPDPRE